MSEDINARLYRMDQSKLREPVRPYSNKLAETLKESAIIVNAMADERAAILAWLQSDAPSIHSYPDDMRGDYLYDLITAIQSGAHHKQENSDV